MDAKTCIKKLHLINGVSMATVDEDGSPQIRIMGVMRAEDEKLYFLTARGKDLYRELKRTEKVAVVGLSRFKEMIRLNGKPEFLPQSEQKACLDMLFEENSYLNNVYPNDSRYILEVFVVESGEIEYFNLGVHPIFRESYPIGDGSVRAKGFVITESCIGCGTCSDCCPQSCIKAGTPYRINSENCLHCGLCFEKCPVSAIKRHPLVGLTI